MFTGIIEESGTILDISSSRDGKKIRIRGKEVTRDARIGDSIAINGVCLTVVDLDSESFQADISPETIRRSSLGSCKPGTRVNLERAMSVNSRFGGHIVSGHIDGTARIQSRVQEKNSIIFSFKPAAALMKYIAFKGSVAVDGISLTVASCTPQEFSVSIIPFTLSHTTLDFKQAGEIVNIECDVLSKYVERLLFFQAKEKKAGITMDTLKAEGFL